MICKFCGNEIDDSAEFCFICGQKVSDEATVFVAGSENVYSQSEPETTAPVEPEQVETPFVEEQTEPYVAVTEPVVAPSEVSGEAPVSDVKPEKIKGIGFKKFICFLFAIIGLIIYFSEKKKGNIEKANALLNALMTGLCVKMAVVIVFMANKFMLDDVLFRKVIL